MSEQVLFFYRTMLVGGAELLIRKMAGRMADMGVKVALVCRDMEENQVLAFEKAGIGVRFVRDWQNARELGAIVREYEAVRCVTFSGEDYAKIRMIRHRQKKTLFYAIHFKALTADPAAALFPLQRLVLRSVVFSAAKRGQLVCMDEQTIRYAQDFYGEAPLLETLYDGIIRICVEIPPVTQEALLGRAAAGERRILSIARADFPFKGYLLGLVDCFRDSRVSSRFTLDIVTYGDGMPRLQELLESLPPQGRDRIRIHDKMPFEALEGLFSEAGVYVGMGTTVLDAACRGIVTAPVRAYTDEICCDHFFHEDHRAVAIDDGSREGFLALLDQVSAMSGQDYLTASEKSIELAKRHYDVKSTTDQLMARFDGMRTDAADAAVTFAEFVRKGKGWIRPGRS